MSKNNVSIRIYFLKKLRSLNVFTKRLHIFYKSVVERAVCFTAICWGSSIRVIDSKKLDKLLKKAVSVLGAVLEPLDLIMQRKTLQKLHNVMVNAAHCLHNIVIKVTGFFSYAATKNSTRRNSCP